MAKKSSKKSSKGQKTKAIEHELVPPHYKLSEEEKKKLLEELGVSELALPRIKISDPAIRHLNPKVGDIIKIVRKSPTAGEYTYYRVVVEE